MKNVLTFAAVAFGIAMVATSAFAGELPTVGVPEPMSVSLLAGGIVAIAAIKRMRRQ